MPASEGKAGVAPASAPEGSPSVPPRPPPPRSEVPAGPLARKVKVELAPSEVRVARGREIVERAKAAFPSELTESSPRTGVLARLSFPPGAVLRVCTWLRDEGTFAHCALVGGIDWRETREVLYLLWSDDLHLYVELSTLVPSEDAHLESVSGVWFGAAWHEREAWDLLGIRFDHHPDLRRLFLPEGYQFHPLLKTFELHEPEELEVKARLGR